MLHSLPEKTPHEKLVERLAAALHESDNYGASWSDREGTSQDREQEEYLARAEEEVSLYRSNILQETLERAERAEATLGRVEKLAEQWMILRTHGCAAYELREILQNTEVCD